MYRNGRFIRLKSQSGPEVQEDASKIFDEILQYGSSRLRKKNNNLKPSHQFRPGHISSGNGLDEKKGIKMIISNHLPSVLEETTEGDLLKHKRFDSLPKKESNGQDSPDMSAFAADTEGDSALVSEHRKKKNLFQKARNRFMHALHRQEREKENREKDNDLNSPSKQTKKTTSPDANKNALKDSRRKGKDLGTLDNKDFSGQVENGDKAKISGGKGLMNTLRKSFRMKKDTDFPAEGTDGHPFSSQSSPHRVNYKHQSPSSDPELHPRHSLTPEISSVRKSSSPSPFPHSSSTDSQSKSITPSSIHSHLASGTNVLDNPGDDIKFMDGIEDDVLPHNQLPIVYVDDLAGSDRCDGNDDFSQVADDRKQLYSKIAQKLIDMGESFAAESGVSETECQVQGGASNQHLGDDDTMNDLVKQIVDCLRTGGDTMSSQVVEDIKETAKVDVYMHFQKTVQHSLGEELSWDRLAFLFYTAKGVISAIGKGSKLAGDVKEMTLQYYTDKFAAWIVDQGGFDSVLSESDSELD